jgi:hypothetical protein
VETDVAALSRRRNDEKVFTLTLFCLVCSGCQSGGQGWPGSAFTSTPPVADGATASSMAANGPTGTATSPAGTATSVAASNGVTPNSTPTGAAGETQPVSPFGKIWKAISFQQPAPETPPPVSPEMARFNSFIGAIGAQTSQLNINDPPQVTRQKATAILTTLRDWDSVLAAGRSMGVINDATASLLTTTVERLTVETQKLVQYAPSPETINAVKQLGGSLGAAFSSVQGILAQGTTVSQAFLGGSPQ